MIKCIFCEAYWVFIITEILKEELGLNIQFGQLVFTCRINNMFRILFKKKYLYSCLNSVEKMVLFRVSSCKICGKKCFNFLERYFDFEYVFYQQNINHNYFPFHFCHLIQWNMGIMNLALHVEILLFDMNRSYCFMLFIWHFFGMHVHVFVFMFVKMRVFV